MLTRTDRRRFPILLAVIAALAMALLFSPVQAQEGSAPDKPRGLSATAWHDSVTLTWDDPEDDSITGYVILRRLPGVDPEGQFSELVANTGTDAAAYTDASVAAGTRYTYRIQAINEHGPSERSRWLHVDIPAAREAAVSQPRSAYVDAHNAGVHEFAEFPADSDPLSPDGAAGEEDDDASGEDPNVGKQGKSVGTQQGRSSHTVDICNRTQEVRDALLEAIGGGVTCSTVTDAQLAGVTRLEVDGYSRTSIAPSDFAGLSSLTKLQIINSRELTTLPANAFRELTGLAGFEELHLRSNRIETIDSDAFAGLTFTGRGWLILSDNRINSLPPGSFNDVTGVKRLNLTDNHITGRYVSGLADGLAELEQLYLIRNHIKVLPAGSFEGLDTLTTLRLQHNGLTILEANTFSGLTTLRALDLTGNALQELPAGIFSDLGNLKNLYLESNSLTTLRKDVFEGRTNLARLELHDNRLTELDKDIFDGLSQLDTLYLHDNELTQLDEDIFDGLSSLRYLYIPDNKLTQLDEDIFDGLSSLYLLDVNGNQLTELDEDIFDGLGSLAVLNLYANSLTSLPSDIFAPLSSSPLYQLALSDNNFGSLPPDVFDGLTSLEYLFLHRTGLTELDSDLFDPLTSLTWLYLYGNDLTTLPADIFDGRGILQRLYLHGNELATLPADIFDSLGNLQRLYLDGNELTTLPADIFDGLAKLEDLNLDANLLSALPAAVFEDLDDSLTDLYLRDNSLTALPAGVFGGLTGLRRLDLSCNALTALDLEVFDPFAGTLKYLDLGANSFSTPPTEAAVNAKLTALDALYLTGSRPCPAPFDTGLSELSLSDGTLIPAFVPPGVTEYSALVDLDISELTITATPRSPSAVIVERSTIIPGRFVYDNDPNSPGIQVDLEDLRTLVTDIRTLVAWRVIAKNGFHGRNYSVEVYREHLPGSVARLRSLELSDLTLSPEFSSATDDYEAEGPATATETIVTAIPLDPDASVEIRVNDVLASDGETVDILPDPSTVTVEVTAEDKTTTRTYQVRVTRRAPGKEGEFRLNPDMQEDYEDPDNSRYAGKQSRLEVFHADRWGTVCSDRFKGSDITTHPSHGNLAPKLSCQAMGYDDGEYASGFGTSGPHQSEEDQDNYLRPGGAYPADGPLPIWLDDVMCWTRADWPFTDDPTPDYGRLMYLENPEDPEDQAMTPYLCAYAGWGLHNGTHREDAGVRCWYDSEQSAQDNERALKGHFLSLPNQHDGSKRVKVTVVFSEPIDETPEGMRNHGVRVEGGQVTAVHREGGQPGPGTRSAGGPASRQVVWVIEIQPTSAEDLTLSLDGGRPCHEPGAICTADGRTLSKGISTTVKGPSSLTASFQDMPDTHDGETPFTFRVAFSEDIDIGLPALREDAFTVTGGKVANGQRVDDQHDLFEVTVEPNSGDDVTITLPAGRDCSVSGAICTTGENQRLLSNSPTAKVAGPTNTPATGAPSIRGTAQVGETLTADITGIADADGLSGETFTYQWVSGDGTTDTDIEKATGSTYKLVDADQGKAIKVRVTFTDGGGNEETLTSAPTGPVWGDGRPGAPRNLAATARKQGDHPVLGPARRQRQRARNGIPHRVEGRRQGLRQDHLGHSGKYHLYDERPGQSGQWSQVLLPGRGRER